MAEVMNLPIRIVINDPIPGVGIALQRGATAHGELVPPAASSPHALAFEFEIRVDGALAEGRPRLLGPFVQGPPGARFVYLCVGRAAGQFGSEWSRRVKVPLGGILWDLLRMLPPQGRIEAHIASRGRDGSPACATVALLDPGWRIV